MKEGRKQLTMVFSLVLMIALWTGGGGLSSPAFAQAQKGQTVQAGYIPLISYAPFFIAFEKGYYAEQGIKVNLIRFSDSGKMMGPMASGELDVGSGGVAAGLFNSIAEGMKTKVVADKGSTLKGYGFNYLVLHKDLAAEVKDYKDLKGRVVLLNAPGSPVRYYLHRALQKGGLSEKDVTLKFIPFPQMPLAFKQKAGDLGVVVDPQGARAILAGDVVDFKNSREYPVVDQQVAVIFYSQRLIETKSDLGKRFMVAYVKACQYYNQKANMNEMADILVKHTGVDRSAIVNSTLAGIRPNGRVDAQDIMEQQEFWYNLGEVKKKVNVNEVVDQSFVNHAGKVLGIK